MSAKSIIIGYLYPEYMNIYGDTGNIHTLRFRAAQRGIDTSVKVMSKTAEIEPSLCDLFFFGGGQDEQQAFVSHDIQKYKNTLCDSIEKGVPALTVCGGYQLFGKQYHPFEGHDLIGLGIFDIETNASNTRMIDNICIKLSNSITQDMVNMYQSDSEIPGTLVGFENHSGQTEISSGEPLGVPLYGYGNNESKNSEGYRYKNAFGTYMHGSLLPKNPHFADYLLCKALEIKYGEPIQLEVLDDTLEYKAHDYVRSKLGVNSKF